MAEINISKIKVNNNNLIIKDIQARENIVSLSTNISNELNSLSTNISDNYLPLSGGTIEGGSIYNKGSSFVIKSTIDPNNPPSENNNWSSGFYIQDKDGGNISSIRVFQSASTNQYNLRFSLMRDDYSHTFDLKLADDGTKSVGLDKTAWLKALFSNKLSDIKYLTGITSGHADGGYIGLPLSTTFGGTGVSTATANYVFAAPSDSNGEPSFRKLVANDIPNLNASKITAGFLAVARGGTGVATANANTFFAGPSSGNAAAPSFRALNTADLPTLSLNNLKSDASFLVAKSGSVTRKLYGLHLICWSHGAHGGIGVVDGWSGVNIFYDSASTKITANLDTDTYTITNNYTGYSNMRYLIINFNESTQ